MQRPVLDPANEDDMDLEDLRTRLWTAPSPNNPYGLGLFGGLPSPPPRKKRGAEPSPAALRPGLTPWMHDWASDKNDFLPEEGLDFWDDDLPDDDFSLGKPLDKVNYWEKPWIQARKDKKAQEIVRKAEQASKRKEKKKRSIPLSKVGRKRAWKKRAEGKPERVKGKFFKKEEIIIIGED
ncbi:hypothetical protein VTL71DRAFT_10609 [Oculimacula yallundae]|uniref:Uncharacterized protein n=1 Tax=Oculimacula yallundae TaxID=86028 RepID=A0ABR4CTV7_9HELO